MNYDSNNLVKVSDHRPVFAQFMLAFDRRDKDNLEVSQRNRDRAQASLRLSAKKSPRAGHNRVVPLLPPELAVQPDPIQSNPLPVSGTRQDIISPRVQQILDAQAEAQKQTTGDQQPDNQLQIQSIPEAQEKVEALESSVLVQQMVADNEEFRNFGEQTSRACSIF